MNLPANKSNPAPSRHIRLKEWGQLADTSKRPTDDYISRCSDNIEQKHFSLRTDVNGNIRTGNSLTSPGGRRKVLLLGGSSVEGLFCDEELRFPSQLERFLDTDGINLQVWNGGYSGATLLHTFLSLLSKYLGEAPYIERVFLFFSANDVSVLKENREFWTYSQIYTPILNDSRTKSSVKNNRQFRSDSYVKLLECFICVCRNFEIPISFVRTPFRNTDYAVDSWAQSNFTTSGAWQNRKDELRNLSNIFSEIAESNSVDVLEFDSAFCDKTDLFYDDLHYSVQGHTLLAELISHEFQDRYL